MLNFNRVWKGFEKMGKKRQTVSYDREALSNLAIQMIKIRQPIKNGNIPQININLDSLEEIIKALPKKERELLERFYGLIPGKANHSLKSNSHSSKDLAFSNMKNSASMIMWNLLKFEYMYQYDKQVEEVISGIATKIDKDGVEEVSDIDAIKYLLIFIIFIVGGPRLGFEEEGYQIDPEEEKRDSFDEYALLNNIWRNTGSEIPDNSINLKLLIDTINMFDLKDIVAMKRFVRLPISKEFETIQEGEMETFFDIRRFKERVFSDGEWCVTEALIYGSSAGKPNMANFAKHIPKFRADWSSVEGFKTKELSIVTSEGEKKLNCYEIGGFEFTDIYEIMNLYVNRRILAV